MESFDDETEFVAWIDATLARINGRDCFGWATYLWENHYEQAEYNAIKFAAPWPPDNLAVLRRHGLSLEPAVIERLRTDLRGRLVEIRVQLTGVSTPPPKHAYKATPKVLKVIRLLEKNKGNDEINRLTGESVGNINTIRSRWKNGHYIV